MRGPFFRRQDNVRPLSLRLNIELHFHFVDANLEQSLNKCHLLTVLLLGRSSKAPTPTYRIVRLGKDA